MWQELSSLSCFQPIKYDSCGLFLDVLMQLRKFLLFLVCEAFVSWKGVFILSGIFSKSIEMITAMFCSVVTILKKKGGGNLLSQKYRPMTDAEDLSSDSAWENPLSSSEVLSLSGCFHQFLHYQTCLRLSPSQPSHNAHRQEGRKEKWKDKLSVKSGMVLAVSQCFRVLSRARAVTPWRQLCPL